MREIAIDIDGILTLETEGYGPEYYPKRTPSSYNIATLQGYKRRGFIIKLYSARFEEDRHDTLEWLRKHKVPFDVLILNKPQAYNYYDDRAINQLDREILCMSGGLDSIIAWHYLEKPQCIQVNFKHKYYVKEHQCLNRLHDIIPDLNFYRVDGPDLSRFETGDTAYIPQRNLHLALMASHYGNKIYIGGIKGDNVSDKTPEAFRVMSFAMNFIKKESEHEIKIDSPFWNMTKTDIVKWFIDSYSSEYTLDVLKTSVSCYDNSTWNSCGQCSACFRKWIALESNDIKSYDWFENDIRKWKGIQQYKERIKEGYYDIKRSQETQAILDKYNL